MFIARVTGSVVSTQKVDEMIQTWISLGQTHGKDIETAELWPMWNKVNLMLGQFADWLEGNPLSEETVDNNTN